MLFCTLFSRADVPWNANSLVSAKGAESSLLGDANNDGVVNVNDISTIAAYILGDSPQPFVFANADANGDGVINVNDISATATIILDGDDGGVHPMSESDLEDWNEGYVMIDNGNLPSVYMLLKQDVVTGNITMCISDASNTDAGKAVCALFDSTGKLEFVTGEGKTGLVTEENGIKYMAIYNSDGQLLMKEKIADPQVSAKYYGHFPKGAPVSSLVGLVLDGKGYIQNFIDFANIENKTDAANLITNVGTGLVGTGLVSLAGLTGWTAVITGVAVGGLLDGTYALIRKLLYGSCNVQITKVIVQDDAFKIGVNIANNSALDTGERKYFAVVGRTGSDRVDYTHKDYSTANYEVSRASQAYYEIPLLEDIQVGHITFVPYLQTEGGLSGKYNTIKEWTIKYGEKYKYVYPDPQIISCQQTGGVEFDDYIMVKLTVKGSICSTKNVSKVGYELLSVDGEEYVDLISEGIQYVSGKDYEFTIVEKIDKKYFSKNKTGDFAFRVYAVGTNDGRGYSEFYPIKLGLFTCPDDHHPHAIDLGLPSGIKWCCCNVGASTPEGYGGYYAWGETSEKSYYYWDTYAYYNSNTGSCTNIGSDIAGSQYDVAHVRMGAPWRMPSTEQQQELIQNCTRTWTQQNGVNGTLVTGKNGGQIFLPAAGYRWDDYLNGAGSYGCYWSSSLYPCYDYDACYLLFGSGNWGWYYDYRSIGRSVRAVCP